MPSSPNKSPKGSTPNSTPNYSRTKRSSVSKAFDNNRLLKDPNATASVGTMADPAATAPEILASGPNIRINMKGTSSLAGPGSSALKAGPSGSSPASGGASKIPVSANLASAGVSKVPSSKVISGEASKASPVSSVASGGASKAPSSPNANGAGAVVASGSKIASAATSQTGGIINKQSTTILGQSQEAQTTTTTTQDAGGPPPTTQPIINTGGLVTIGTRSGAVAELVLAVVSGLLFTGIFVYFVSGKCRNIWLESVNGYVESAYVFIGMVTSIFLVFHSCFERGFQAGRGVFGCIIFFVISGAILINLWGSFRLGYSCVCSCRQGIESAFHKNAYAENAILFLMDLVGCICLILILLIASIFKLFESAMPNIQPGHMDIKDLRRDQLLDYYDDATKTLQTLIKAKESEIEYRRDLINMMEQSKSVYDNKLSKVKEDYQTARKNAPETLDLRGLAKTTIDAGASGSTTPPLPPPMAAPSQPAPRPQNNPHTTDQSTPSSQSTTAMSQQSSTRGSEFDIPAPVENNENRSSLDRRLSEFLKTFPNLTQAGLAPPTSNDAPKTMPGYYTQQLAPPPPIPPAPSMMAMMRVPPPNLIQINQPPPGVPPQPPHTLHQTDHQENHDTTDMDLSDLEDAAANTNGSSSAGGLIPMVASAMQQGAGGKQNVRPDPQSQNFTAGQQFNNPIQYTTRMNALPFDPSIMDPGLRDSSSSHSRDRHSPGGHRSGSSSRSGGGSKHSSSSKTRYSSSSSTSSHSSERSKRR